MKKKIILTITIIIILTILVACSPQTTTKSAQEQVQTQIGENQETFNSRPTPSEVTCPHGRVYEDYAGCGLYKDSDNSGYCDHSE